MQKIKNIVVISLGFLGDTLLVEPMCRNIKSSFPNSKLIFIVNNIFKDVSLGFDSVDTVYGYDKKGKNKGFIGYFNFLKEFKEEKIDYAIITHPHERSLILAKMIGAKNIISLPVKKSPLNFFINKKRKYDNDELRTLYKADYNNKYLKGFCFFENYPVSFNLSFVNEEEILCKFNLPEKYIVLSPTSKDLIKDWDYENIKNFILKTTKEVVLVGTEKANKIAKRLKEEKINFIDLSLKTNIKELALIIKNASNCVSVDTGTFHLSYAQKIPTIALFFNKQMVLEWAPAGLNYVKVLIGERQGDKDNFVCIKEITAEEVLENIYCMEKY